MEGIEHINVLCVLDRHSKPKSKRTANRDFIDWLGEKHGDVKINQYGNTVLDCNSAYRGFRKYDKPNVFDEFGEIETICYEKAVEWCWQELSPWFAGRLISFDEVHTSTEQGRSPGFPWNKKYRTTEEFWSSPDIGYLETYWEKSGRDAFCVWNCFDKEELRKTEKVKAKNNRQINGCPAEYKYAMNRYVLAQNQEFYSSHLKTMSAVGINPFNGGWEELYFYLSVFKNGFAADLKSMDSDFQRRVMESIRDIRWNCMTAELRQSESDRQRFFNLYEEQINSCVIMPWGELLQKLLGMPSGSPNTVVDNSMGSIIMFGYCFIRAWNQKFGTFPTYADWKAHVRAVIYGDDNTYTGSELGLELLGPSNIIQYAKEMGWTITFEVSVPRALRELDFLSKRFTIQQYHGRKRITFVPLDGAKALCSIAWRDSGDTLNTWARVCGIRIMYFFDTSVIYLIEEYAMHLRRSLENHYGPNCPEWQAAKFQYLPDHKIWDLYLGRP